MFDQEKFKSSPGTYYIGDPCYIIKDEIWSEFCDLLFTTEISQSHRSLIKFNFHKTEILVGNTFYGDGCYQSDCCKLMVPVDAGLIGLVKIEGNAIDEDKLKNYPYNIIKFDNDFESDLREGIFYFGKYTIDTKNSDDEDYDSDRDEKDFENEEDE